MVKTMKENTGHEMIYHLCTEKYYLRDTNILIKYIDCTKTNSHFQFFKTMAVNHSVWLCSLGSKEEEVNKIQAVEMIFLRNFDSSKMVKVHSKDFRKYLNSYSLHQKIISYRKNWVKYVLRMEMSASQSRHVYPYRKERGRLRKYLNIWNR